MSRHRQQRRADKARRHLQPTPQPSKRAEWSEAPPSQRVPVREADHVERLAYTRSQAAQALGVSRSTLRRLLPYLETIELPWGTQLIPVDELERLAIERRRAAPPRRQQAPRGRRPVVPLEVAKRIRDERSEGRTLRQIADDLNSEGIATAHGGEKWWPSTVRAVLQRAA